MNIISNNIINIIIININININNISSNVINIIINIINIIINIININNINSNQSCRNTAPPPKYGVYTAWRIYAVFYAVLSLYII
jgi:hypothetical protein